MVHKRISIPFITHMETMNVLGRIQDGIEFVDINSDIMESHKNFTPLIKSCEEMEKIISKFEKVCEDHEIVLKEYTDYSKFIEDVEKNQNIKMNRLNRETNYLDLIKEILRQDDIELDNLISSHEDAMNSLEVLKEEQAILLKANKMIIGKSDVTRIDTLEAGLSSNFAHISGVINADDAVRMGRSIFRVSRGRAMPTFFDFKGIRDGKKYPSKKIFTITFLNEGEKILHSKLLRVCDLFNAIRYVLPSVNEIPLRLEKINNEISVIDHNILRNIRLRLKDFILDRAGEEDNESIYSLYKFYIKKEKQSYQNLNKCVLRGSFLIGSVWIPKDKYDEVELAIKSITKGHEYKIIASLNDEAPTSVPPTFFKLNDLTYPFQEIVNTYGIPRYQEANPSIFAIVTFPFLFGVMFGDIGHGFLLLLFGIYLLWNNTSLQKSALKPLARARYLFLLMGFFAFFSGWMYNDFLSIPLDVFGSCYRTVKKINLGNCWKQSSRCKR
jgi:V-type H+-transporting ATPase subunit a